MSGIIDQVDAYADALRAAKIRATTDPRNVNPPCVLLVPPTVQFDLNCGGTAEFVAYVIGAGPANLDAWRTLDKLAADVAAVIPIEQLEPSTYTVDAGGDMPAFALRWSAPVSFP